MSEQLNQPLSPAERAQGAEWDEMIAERNLEVQMQDEQAAYDATRPYLDAVGNVHDPVTNTQINPDIYHQKKRDEHADSAIQTYEDMGMVQLTHKLADAEISGDKSTYNEVEEVLLNKLIEFSEPLDQQKKLTGNEDESEIIRKTLDWQSEQQSAERLGESADPVERLMQKLINEKDRYKQEVTMSKVDTDFIDTTRKYIDDLGGDSSEIMKEVPVEAELKGKTDKERWELMPDSYKELYGKDPNIARNRIDKDVLENWVNTLLASGVPREIIQEFPASFFYNDDDPEQTDDYPEAFAEWLEKNPDTKIGQAKTKSEIIDQEKINNSAKNILIGAADEADDSSEAEPEPRKGIFARIRARMNDPAVTFEKIENRVGDNGLEFVKTREQHVDTDREINKKAMIALGIGGIAIGAAIISAKTGGPNVLDLWPFGGDDSVKDVLDGSPDSSGDSGTGGVDNTGPEATEAKPPVDESPDVQTDLEVGSGSGFEDSIQDQYGLTDEQAHEAFEQMRPYLENSDGTYVAQGDLRIGNPGDFQLNDQAQKALQKYLEDNNLL